LNACNREFPKVKDRNREDRRSSVSNPEPLIVSDCSQRDRRCNDQRQGHLRHNEYNLGQIQAVLGDAVLDRRGAAKAVSRVLEAVLRSDSRASADGAAWEVPCPREVNQVWEALAAAVESQVEEALGVAGYPVVVLLVVADLAVAVDRKEVAVAGEDEQAGRSCDRMVKSQR